MQSDSMNRRQTAVRAAKLARAAATLAGTAAVAAICAAPASAAPLDVAGAVRDMNAARAEIGCPSLAASDQLNAAAAGQSGYMASSKIVSDLGPDKSTPADRVKATGYNPKGVGEAVLVTAPTQNSRDAVKAWLAGGKSKAYILDCRLTDVGIGMVSGSNSQSYWTLVLARPN
ncbi:CAP domain-containing protein [Skermania piniformis]|uniref:CAP domain-containing protein n=1 Tax=Skermania pinensis TaxID=39122 RepID=A0ABX8SD72_9ACTN|nr:CAP domain-containing protein [Skermania piniformis]QXQ14385.1 CAP domain-containing protein [Skermania piniformis]